jgi:hypothetical protein
LAAIFVVAGAAKLSDLDGFSATLRGIGLLAFNVAMRGLAAATIAIVELLVGFALALGILGNLPILASLLLSTAFLVITARALIVRAKLVCRCFGTLAGSQFTPAGLVRALLLMLAAFLLLTVTGMSAGHQPIGAWAVAVGWAYLLLAIVAAQASQSLRSVAPDGDHP